MDIKSIGWNEHFESQIQIYREQGLITGRVLKEVRHLYEVITEDGLVQSEVSGHFHFTAVQRSDYPTVGDWVVLRRSADTALIEKVLQRQSYFSRKTAGSKTEEQIVAANIDYICIVCGLDGGRNFKLRGVERYIAMTVEGGAKPVLILNKSDICTDTKQAVSDAEKICGNIPVFAVSALTGKGIDEISAYFPQGSTIAFCGHSGTGKSSLINMLMKNNIMKTGSLRESDLRGKHTTTHKELFFLQSGAMVIDTPGMRELQLWGDANSLQDVFHEVAEAAENCRFNDCTHQGEPGCAVKKLLDEGNLDQERFENYLSMRAEMKFLESRVTEKGRAERKAHEKELSKTIKRFYKQK